MNSLKALLNAKSFESLPTSNPEVTNNSCRKRGALLEEWLLRKFPELYKKSHDIECATITGNDVENQPLKKNSLFVSDLVKRSRIDLELKTDACGTHTSCTGHLSPKTLRINSNNLVNVERTDSRQQVASNDYWVLPKGDLISLKDEQLLKQVDSDRLWRENIDGKEYFTINGGKDIEKVGIKNQNSLTASEDVQGTSSMRSDDKYITNSSINLFASNKQIVKPLNAPKLTRHNDAAYYPNIQCLLCREWVCSRNRYMHVESHLQYRPYKCSFCGYDNRKEIFIILHIKKMHGGRAEIIRDINTELEHEAWNIAERCVEHTRDVLLRARQEAIQAARASTSTECADSTEINEALVTKHPAQYRPKFEDAQRTEKSLLIEDVPKMDVPDFSEISNREVQCQICNSFVISHIPVMEEHTRLHLAQPSYRCSIGDCALKHHSKNFLTRHMKEVHKFKQNPTDILKLDLILKKEFRKTASRCFPNHFLKQHSSFNLCRQSPTTQTSAVKSLIESNCSLQGNSSSSVPVYGTVSSTSTLKSTLNFSSSPSPQPTLASVPATTTFPENALIQATKIVNDTVASLLPLIPFPSTNEKTISYRQHLSLPSSQTSNSQCKSVFRNEEQDRSQCVTLTSLLTAGPKNNPAQTSVQQMQSQTSPKLCSFCEEVFEGDYLVLYRHVKQHLSILPYECSSCKFSDVDKKAVQEHIVQNHNMNATLIDRMTDSVSRQCSALFTACFPNVPLQPLLHDGVRKLINS
ncbi:unnamed protein product [Thelazia callipaeda]|uniref:C2H2-type domain-containing protein n=1 Tax=Thelazia callipaeda TaxID=103827 RepID=A0A0N5CQB1_THECL|nr:unnamed protein product [Thelazia callipaeda]